MTVPSLSYLGLGLTLAVSLHVAAATPRLAQKKTTASGPTIIAFAPSEVEGQKDDGSIEGVAHTQYAMQDTAKCLRPKKVAFQFWFADRLVVRSGNSTTTFEVWKLGQGFGAILIEPGRPPKVVYSTDGPSTLQFLLPQAAVEFWHAKGCKDVG
jgi:hypothetical protein